MSKKEYCNDADCEGIEGCTCGQFSKSASVTGYVPSVDEIKAFTPVQAKGFIVGNITLKLYNLGMPAEQAGEMANFILYKAGA